MTSNLFGDRYQVGDTLGFGGMSEVHRGRDLRLGRDVAIKVLRADLAREPTFQTRFRREAQNAASLNHPAIVAVYDTGETVTDTGPVPYIVMEYVDGETLRDLLKREGPLPAKRAMEIVADVCAALDFSHRHGIIHRDVKPANIMLTRNGAVKVMDFGIARAAADGQATVTATAAVIGTAQYLSPEQARGEAVDARSDVYSTGCVLYELLTGAPPFSGDSPVAVAYQHVREEPKAPSSVRPDVPRELDAIVLTALNKNPLNRYQTAAEMRADLVRALTGQAVHATPVMNDNDRTELLQAAPAGAPAILAPPSILSPNDAADYDDAAARSRRIWGFVGIGALCLALLAGAIFLTLKVISKPAPPAKIAVTKVVGMTPDDATAALREQGLTVGPLKHAASSENQKGIVIRQNPSEGVPMEPGAAVTLIIGEGVAQVPVPNVQNMEAADAERTIKKLNLNYVEEKVNSPSVVAGRVAKQDPVADTKVAPESAVTVYISQGPELTTIPDKGALVGVNVDDAKKALDDAHLKYVTQTQASEKPKDEVIALGDGQKPGDSVQVDTVITLVVSDHSLMTMPNLSNLTPDDAVKKLQSKDVGWTGDAGFLGTKGEPDPHKALWGKITGQVPNAGDTVPRNTPVNVIIATEPQITVPDLSGMTPEEVQKALGEAGWAGELKVVTDNGAKPPDDKEQTVIPNSQSPGSGSVIPMTDTVTVTIYPKKSAETTSTSATPTTTATTSTSGDDDGDHDGGG